MRPKLTYANVMATIAVFIAFGGASYAASHLGKHSVGARQLKRNAVTTTKLMKEAVTAAKVKKGTLTGMQINNSTLGTVPSAANADKVNGQFPEKIFKTFSRGESNVPIASIAGFTLTATCEEENVDATLKSPITLGSVIEAEGSGHESNVFEYNSAKSGEVSEVRLDGKSGERGDIYGETTFSAALSDGTVISGDVAYDYNTFNGSELCLIYGEATTG